MNHHFRVSAIGLIAMKFTDPLEMSFELFSEY